MLSQANILILDVILKIENLLSLVTNTIPDAISLVLAKVLNLYN